MLLFLGAGIPALCLARTLDLTLGYCAVLDRIAVVGSQTERSSIALEILELVALGRTAIISAESELQVGLEAGQVKKLPFTSPEVRVCAFRVIGESGLAGS